MKTNQLFWGILLITFGILLFLGQMDIIDFSLWNILSFWPLALILVGINLLGINDNAKIITSIVTSVAVIIVAITMDTRPTFIKFIDKQISNGFAYNHNNYNDEEYSDISDTAAVVYCTSHELFSQNSPKSGKIELACTTHGKYDIQGDADFNASKSSQSYLYSFMYPEKIECKFELRDLHGYREIDIEPLEMKELRTIRTAGDEKFSLTLNSSIPWILDIDGNSAQIDADLTAVNLQELNIEQGKSTRVKFGILSDNTTVNIDSHTKKILFEIPKEIGFKVISESSYSDIKYDGDVFAGQQSSNYNASTKKMIINLDSNVSKIEIKHY